ncbi:hypothetical protein H0H93_002640 [Arthromyces matolae]|nr:hypothetical protein H0H93_002640 [Arthromyces matolae]
MSRRSARISNLAVKDMPETGTASGSTTCLTVPTSTVKNSGHEEARPKKKIQKRTQKKDTVSPGLFKNVRGRQGALRKIVEMPLDILHESLMHLTPVDILHVSQTCKAFRQMLISKSAEFIWKQARMNLDDGFPDCPADLNEAHIVTKKRDLILYGQFGDAAVGDVSTKKTVSFVEWIPNKHQQFGNDQLLVCKISAADIRKKYNKVAPRDQDSWIQARLTEKEQLVEHGRRVESWLEAQKRNRYAELENARESRYKAITQRLVDLGWEEELKAVSIDKLPCVRQSRELTDRIWDRIKDKIIKELQPERSRLEYQNAQTMRWFRLEQCLKDLRKKYFYRRAFPKRIFRELSSTDGISALIKAPTSEQVEFPDSLLLEKVHDSLEKHCSDLRALMDASPTQAQILLPEAIDPLCLATTFFQWHKEDNPSMYPEVLAVQCTKMFSEKAFHLTNGVLSACGLDPTTTTRDVVDDNFFLECGECPLDTSGKRSLMAWQTGWELTALKVWHALGVHKMVEQPRLVRAILNESELEALKKLVAENLEDPGRFPEFKDFECVRCQPSASPFIGTKHGLTSHIKQERRRKAWTNLAWKTASVVQVNGICHAYELVGGVFAHGDSSGAEFVVSNLPSTNSFGSQTRRSDIQIQPRDFAIDPGQDLVVFIEEREHPLAFADPRIYRLLFYSISTHEPHPNARLPTIPVIVPSNDAHGTFVRSVMLQISDDVVAVTLYTGSQQLVIFNWKEGYLITVNAKDSVECDHFIHDEAEFAFISPRAYLLTYPEGNGALSIYTFASVERYHPIHVATLNLPALAEDSRLNTLTIHTGPFETPLPHAPFTTSPLSRVYVLTLSVMYHPLLLTLTGDPPRTETFYLFIKCSTFLQYLSTSEEFNLEPPSVPWSQWGPSSTRLLSGLSSYSSWLRYVHGQRVVLPQRRDVGSSAIKVLDFNTRAVESDSDIGVCIEPTEITHCFQETVTTSLPYSIRSGLLSGLSDTYSAYMIDEERIVGIKARGPFDEEIKELHLYTF